MVPTLRTTLGVKGHRPVVGNFDNKDCVYCFGSMNLTDGSLTTRLHEVPARARARNGRSKYGLLIAAFVRHLEDVARRYPASEHRRVVMIVDNATWHKGPRIREAIARHPHLELYYLPPYSPQLNPVERLWKILRRRATHNRLFETMKAMRSSLRNSLCYYQTIKSRILSLIHSPRKQKKSCAG